MVQQPSTGPMEEPTLERLIPTHSILPREPTQAVRQPTEVTERSEISLAGHHGEFALLQAPTGRLKSVLRQSAEPDFLRRAKRPQSGPLTSLELLEVRPNG